jgi:glycosyltransferase involved in cell wall biosynthesis
MNGGYGGGMSVSDPKRILLLAHNIEGIGTYIRFERLAVQLSRMGHTVTLVAGAAPGRKKILMSSESNFRKILVPELFAGRLSNGGLGPLDTLYRILFVLHNEFDIVHASEHRPAASFPALVSRRFQSTRYVSDWADWWGKGGIVEDRSRLMRRLLCSPETFFESAIHRSADGVTVISQTLRDRALELGIHADRLLVLTNGADVEGIRPQPREEARRRLGLPAEGKILVYAGLAPIDMDLVWKSFAIVDAKSKGAVYLLVLGRKWCLPEPLGAARERVIQVGWVDRGKYPSYLACGDIMLLPFRRKTINMARWPGKLGDYLAAGRPIVANPTGEVRRLLENEPVGLPAGETPVEFAGAILSLLSDSAACIRMGARAREVAEDELSWERVVRPLPDFYRAIQAQSR